MSERPFSDLDPTGYALPEELTARLISPALIVYVDRVRQNLATMLEHLCGDADRWRPHVKTAKIPAVFAEYARAGLRQFKCATTREARELLAALEASGVEASDLLIAYPLVGPAIGQIQRLAELHPKARLSVLCETAAAVKEMPRDLSIFVDVNPGMDRTGVPTTELSNVLEVARAAGTRFRGVHFYDGHIHTSIAILYRSR